MPDIKITSAEGTTSNTVIRLNDLKTPEDFERAGFPSGTTRDNFGVIVHVTDSLEPIKVMSQEGINDALSASYITPKDNKTYKEKKFGVILLNVRQSDIIVASQENIDSGIKKTEKDICAWLLSGDTARIGFSEKLRAKLSLDREKYSELFKELSKTQSITGIEDPKIRTAISETINEHVINPKEHNELLVYKPQIAGIFAKKCKPEQVPYEFRKYAEEQGLPIVIFGDCPR